MPLFQRIKNAALSFSAFCHRIIERFFKQPLPTPEPANDDTAALPAKTRKRKAAEDFDSQSFYFRDAILDHLENYFVHIRKMRRADRDSYNLYSKLGASILPSSSLFDRVELSPWFRKAQPTFGAVALAIGTENKEEEIKADILRPRFICFTKYDSAHQPAGIQRASGGTFYKVSLFWDDPAVPSMSAVTETGIVLTTDGVVVPLKQLVQKRTTIKHRKGAHRISTRIQHKWAHPSYFIEWAEKNGMTADAFLVQFFILAANMFEASQSGTLSVTCRSKGLVAKFTVDPTRTAYFFKDRNTVVGARGQTRRIFHVVRVHERKNGQAVKSHFRGLRSFCWNGFDISITVPVREHSSLADFSAPSLDVDGQIPGHVGTAELADRLCQLQARQLSGNGIKLEKPRETGLQPPG